MSETPRTDAEGVRFARLLIEWPEPGKQRTTELVPADFARQLERALRLAREFIRREQIEHAVVDLKEPNVGLGEYLDRILAPDSTTAKDQ